MSDGAAWPRTSNPADEQACYRTRVSSPEEIRRAAELMMDGSIVAFPTETVYGLGALATHPDAVARVFRMKGRPTNRPLIVHLRRATQIDAFAIGIPDYARTLADALWPGPLTLVLKRREVVLDEVTGGGETVAMRVPDHPMALALLEQTLELGGISAGIAAPSANPFGEEPATNAQGVIDGLGRPAVDDENTPDMILDGGDCGGGVPSTIISCVGEWPRILRYGATDKATIEKTIGRWVDM